MRLALFSFHNGWEPCTLLIHQTAANDLAAHAAAAYPEEACGILIGTRSAGPGRELTVERVQITANIAAAGNRGRRFEIDPRDVIRMQRELRGTGTEIVGFYHTHPDTSAQPSSTDLPFLRLWPRTVWLIVEVRLGNPAAPPRAWWIEHGDDVPVELPVTIGGEPPGRQTSAESG